MEAILVFDMHSIYAKRINGRFQPDSEALVLELTLEEMEMKWSEIAQKSVQDLIIF